VKLDGYNRFARWLDGVTVIVGVSVLTSACGWRLPISAVNVNV